MHFPAQAGRALGDNAHYQRVLYPWHRVSETGLGHCNFSTLTHRHFSAYCANPLKWLECHSAKACFLHGPHTPKVRFALCTRCKTGLGPALVLVLGSLPPFLSNCLDPTSLDLQPFFHLARFAKSPSPSPSPHDRPVTSDPRQTLRRPFLDLRLPAWPRAIAVLDRFWFCRPDPVILSRNRPRSERDGRGPPTIRFAPLSVPQPRAATGAHPQRSTQQTFNNRRRRLLDRLWVPCPALPLLAKSFSLPEASLRCGHLAA